jgi:hypothetical protein
MRGSRPGALALSMSLLAAVSAVTACSDDDDPVGPAAASAGPGSSSAASGTGGAGAAGGAGPGGGGHGGGVAAATVEQLRAPDQTTITVRFDIDVAAVVPAATDAFVVASDDVDDLEVESVAYDPATRTVTLTTERQKLGATYQLTIQAPGTALADLGGELLAADTARFWASDFGSPTFDSYEVVADRRVIGEHAVIYVEQGQLSPGTDEAIQFFDDHIFPVETAKLHAPSDVDENGRIVLLALDGQQHYGGYFSPLDTYPAEVVEEWGYKSNETDMVYINVSGGQPFDAKHVLTHEFAHLLYNAAHGLEGSQWSWHNEGLAECAVRLVNGENDYAAQFLYADPFGDLATGLSLVHWQGGNYSQYAQAFLFWSYLAGQLAGVDTYGSLFDSGGSPSEIDGWVQQNLGKTLIEAQRDFMAALRLKAASGPHGFGGIVALPDAMPQPVPSGIASVSLLPFTGVWFELAQPSVDYPGTQGADVVYTGVSASLVDLQAPFDIDGGALLVINTSFDEDFEPPAQPSGPDIAAAAKAASPQQLAGRDPSWRHPPPVSPDSLPALHAWRARTRLP